LLSPVIGRDFWGHMETGVVEQGEKIARSWPAEKPAELWKIDTGEGFGGAAIAGGKVCMLDRKNSQEDIFRVLDLKTGQTIWEHVNASPDRRGAYPGSRGTPTLEGDRAYVVGVSGMLTCFDIAAKKVAWSKSLMKDLGAGNAPWGFAQSPLIVRDMLIISASGGKSGLIALNKQNGEVIWKGEPFGAADTYTSPMLVKIADQEQIAMLHKGAFAGVDPANGKILWKYDWTTKRQSRNRQTSARAVLLTTGYGNGCAMLRIEQSTGAEWTVNEIFQDDRCSSRAPSPLFYKGHIYTNSEEIKRGLQCLTETGDIKWETQSRPSFGLGGMILVDGVIFIVNSDSGELVMAEANPGGYKELGRAKVLGGKDIFGRWR
jgi:outer membrane protein assembly factor BamB